MTDAERPAGATATEAGTPKKSGRMAIGAVPLVLFSILVAIFAYQLLFGRDASIVPSALIGDPVPQVELPPLLEDKPGFGPDDFGGEVVLVNVFASWCGPCRLEHPLITALAEEMDIPVFGLNSKDERSAAIQWLNDLGDPYTRIGYDPDGRAGIEWGVYGYPETFVVSPEGEILFKHVGPISPRIIEQDILPLIEAYRSS
ncbi:MAG: DsbE family thiol:disulfide interchange protein [Alphaproteobacteria bacterium]